MNKNESKTARVDDEINGAGALSSSGTPPAAGPWDLRLAEIEQAVRDWVSEYQPAITSTVTTLIEKAVELSNLAHRAFTQRLGVYPHLAQAILPLAQRGWFISMFFGLSELDQLAVFASEVTAEELDTSIAKLYAEDVRDHTESIVKYFPERAFAIRPAVTAHERGEFALSVPNFLIQADGICFTGSGKHLFRGQASENFISHAQHLLRSERYPGTGSTILSFYNLLWRILLTSMSDKLPVQYSEKQRNALGYTGLNRHTILHGIADSGYATEENSLKAFSLLSCVASLVARTNGAEGDQTWQALD